MAVPTGWPIRFVELLPDQARSGCQRLNPFRSVAAKLRNQRTDTSRDMAAKLWPKCTRQWHSIVGGCRIGVIKGAGYTHKWEEALVQGWIWLPKPPN